MKDAFREEYSLISGELRKHYTNELVHIPDLKPGDRLIWKGEEYRYTQFPKLSEIVEVFRLVSATRGEGGSSSEFHETDFTVLVVLEGNVYEYGLDSRRFKRA